MAGDRRTCNEYEQVSDPVHMQFTPIDQGGGIRRRLMLCISFHSRV